MLENKIIELYLTFRMFRHIFDIHFRIRSQNPKWPYIALVPRELFITKSVFLSGPVFPAYRVQQIF